MRVLIIGNRVWGPIRLLRKEGTPKIVVVIIYAPIVGFIELAGRRVYG